MITQRPLERRKDYLFRVACEYIKSNPIQEYTVDYDETTCDGLCLLEEMQNEIDIPQPEPFGSLHKP